MKKKVLVSLVLMLAVALASTGCGQKNGNSSTPETSGSESSQDSTALAVNSQLLLSTSSSTSSYYAIGAGIADIVNKSNYGFTLSATTSGGSVDNVKRIASGEAELGAGMPDVLYNGANGLEEFEKPVAVKSLCSMWSNPLNIVVKNNGKINSVADLKGKRVSVGAQGTGSQGVPLATLAAYGINENDVTWSFMPIAEQCNALKDGQIDAIMMTMGTGNASFTDLASTTDVKWLSVDEDKIKEVAEAVPFYCKVAIPSNTYPNQAEEVITVGFSVNLYASTERVSEEQAYQIVKAMFDKPGELARYHAVGTEITLDTALDGLATDLHPGALKYFKEKGLVK